MASVAKQLIATSSQPLGGASAATHGEIHGSVVSTYDIALVCGCDWDNGPVDGVA